MRWFKKKPRRVTPEEIYELKTNEIFVFGSNMEGLHLGGAALMAKQKFGAIMYNAYGLQGRSFAIPTKDASNGKIGGTLKIPIIKMYVDAFIRYTEYRPGKKYLVTAIGCGLAGYTPEDIAPLFKHALHNESIWLPESFIEILERREKRLLHPLIIKIWDYISRSKVG